MIIRFNQINGKEKNVFKHIFLGYILPKDKQMISMTGWKVENHLGKGRKIS